MKKIINKTMYDTNNANLIAQHSNGLNRGNFNYVFEDLYLTEKGHYFLHAEGGPKTIYSESNGNSSWGIETIILLTYEQAYNWLEKRNKFEVIEKYFPEMISKG